jgi:hypothetical protein
MYRGCHRNNCMGSNSTTSSRQINGIIRGQEACEEYVEAHKLEVRSCHCRVLHWSSLLSPLCTRDRRACRGPNTECIPIDLQKQSNHAGGSRYPKHSRRANEDVMKSYGWWKCSLVPNECVAAVGRKIEYIVCPCSTNWYSTSKHAASLFYRFALYAKRSSLQSCIVH